jgi:DNA-binding NtrC family response regulator
MQTWSDPVAIGNDMEDHLLMRAAANDSSQPVANPAASHRPRRVLVVEDEALIRWSLTQTLTAAGYLVQEASDAAAVYGLETELCQIDVVLLDLRLPDSKDLGLLAHVRRISPNSAVLLMTAFGTEEVRAAAVSLGAYAVLDKPFDMADADRLVREAFAPRQGGANGS